VTLTTPYTPRDLLGVDLYVTLRKKHLDIVREGGEGGGGAGEEQAYLKLIICGYGANVLGNNCEVTPLGDGLECATRSVVELADLQIEGDRSGLHHPVQAVGPIKLLVIE
jgi:hypothetical protein